MSDVVLRIKDVMKTFRLNHVLRGLNFEVKSGEIFGIIGMSGSGKTTLLNTLIGFIEPDYGDVEFKLEHLLDFKVDDENSQFRSVFKNVDDVKRTFGFAAQTPSFYEKLTPKENLEYFGKMYGLSKEVRRTNADILLRLMRLNDSENVKSENLSGGMQKRLDIACALIHDPKVLILDEPTADLDPVLRRELWDLIKKINNKGTTIIMASHFLDEIENLCDTVGILLDGLIVRSGSPDELRSLYSNDEEVHISSRPGNYDEIIESLNHTKSMQIKKAVNLGHKLVIYSNKSEKVLKHLFDIIDKNNESLTDIFVKKATLEEAFESLIKESRIEKISEVRLSERLGHIEKTKIEEKSNEEARSSKEVDVADNNDHNNDKKHKRRKYLEKTDSKGSDIELNDKEDD